MSKIKRARYLEIVGAFKGAVLALLICAWLIRDYDQDLAKALGFAACLIALVPVWLKKTTQRAIYGEQEDDN